MSALFFWVMYNGGMDSEKIHFEALTVQDLRLMLQWLNSDFVSRWYGKGSYTYEEVFQKYAAKAQQTLI